jgi:acetyl esterase/lipase
LGLFWLSFDPQKDHFYASISTTSSMKLLKKYISCPTCNRTIGFSHRHNLEQCAYTGELVCTRCVISGRFSPNIAEKIPDDFKEKFRIWNVLLFLLVAFLGYYYLQLAWWTMPGWRIYDLSLLLEDALYILKFLIIGIIIIIISTKLPHLGDWLFYWWISIEKNKMKVGQAIADMAKGEYLSKSKLYNFKRSLFEKVKQNKFKILFLLSSILNIAMIPLFFILRSSETLPGTYFSAFAGIIYVGSLICNFLMILVASMFYCHKNYENKKQRIIIELLSWIYVILFPIILITFVLGEFTILGVSAELNIPEFDQGLIIHQIIFVIQTLLIILLSYFLLKMANPNLNLKENEYLGWKYQWKLAKEKGEKEGKLYVIKQIPKIFARIIFSAILLILLILFTVLTAVDPTMAFGVVAPNVLLLGVAVPICFTTLKLLKRKPKRFTQLFWTAAKVSTVIITIACIPAVMTPSWTNISIEAQFDQEFGKDWDSRIPEEVKANWRQTPYSAFENFFGFKIPWGEAEFNVIYCQDSPRWVRNSSTREIISNGSSKYTGKVDSFPIDLYLPPGYEFGKGNETFPVIIFFHGSGMDKGSGNANMSVSRYMANQGYLVVDAMYGYVGWTDHDATGKKKGYDFADTIHHIGSLTKYLANNSAYYHVDVDNFYFAGRSYGGVMAPICGYGYNISFFGTNFSSEITVRGVIPFYGAHGMFDMDSDLRTNEILFGDAELQTPELRGSSHPDDPEYNPEWVFFSPYNLVNPKITGSPKVAPTLFIHGTQDPLVPPEWDKVLQEDLHENGNVGITAFYPLGSHASDVIHWSPYGQSVVYYMERFCAITRSYS